MSNMTESVTLSSSSCPEKSIVPFESIIVDNPASLASLNKPVRKSGCSMHSPPETVIPRINGICFFTSANTIFSSISLVLGELSCGQTCMQVSHATQSSGLKSTRFCPLSSVPNSKAFCGHLSTQTPQFWHMPLVSGLWQYLQFILQPCRNTAVLLPGPSTLLKGIILFTTTSMLILPYVPEYVRFWQLQVPEHLYHVLQPLICLTSQAQISLPGSL